jgi:hypothetical protein
VAASSACRQAGFFALAIMMTDHPVGKKRCSGETLQCIHPIVFSSFISAQRKKLY